MTDHETPTRHRGSEDRRTRPVLEAVAAAPIPDDLRLIGPYRIVRHLGSGGMGTVYLAEQVRPVERTVALKVIQGPSQVDITSDLRFLAEQQALARLSHPNVAQLYDSGRTEDGQAFFAMEYVAGKTLTRYCDDRRLSVRRRLEIFVQVCRGVEHVHQKGVLHRDIKPANVLVTEIDGDAVPKLIDFGIAKGIDRPLAEIASLTGDGVVGTLAYLSPEAVDGDLDRDDLDTRADVYALGILLHELLVGQRPFERHGESTAQVLKRILSSDLQSLGRHVNSLAAEPRRVAAWNRRASPQSLVRELSGELEGIVARATARQRDARYGSAGELAADVSRHLADEPVLAHPPSTWQRLAKWGRRHRLVFAAGIAVVSSLLIGTSAATLGMLRARQEALAARIAQRESDEVVKFVSDLFLASNPGPRRRIDDPIGDVLRRGAERIESELLDQPAVRARLLLTLGGLYRNLGEYDESIHQLEEALRIRRELEGRDSWRLVAETAHDLARSHMERADAAKARPLLEEVIRLRTDRLGSDHRDTLDARQSLATCLAVEGSLDEALAQRLEFQPLLEAAHGPRAVETGMAVLELAGVRAMLGHHVEARPLYDRAIEIFRTAGGDHHVTVGGALVNKAVIDGYLDGPLAERETLNEALRVLERTLDPGHQWILTARYSLGGVLLDLGEFEQVREVFTDLVPHLDRAVGPDHRLALMGRYLLATAWFELGEMQRGADEIEAVLQRFAAVFPADYRQIVDIAATLADFRCRQGELRSAEAAVGRALTELDSNGALSSFEATNVSTARACIAGVRGDHASARRLLEEAVAIRRRLGAGDDTPEANLLASIAESHEAAGESLLARERYLEAVDLYRSQERLDWSASQRLDDCLRRLEALPPV